MQAGFWFTNLWVSGKHRIQPASRTPSKTYADKIDFFNRDHSSCSNSAASKQIFRTTSFLIDLRNPHPLGGVKGITCAGPEWGATFMANPL